MTPRERRVIVLTMVPGNAEGARHVTIREDETFVQIVSFEVVPGRQQLLVDTVASEVERWIRSCPGFISATFHASLDGTRMMNYSQWRSKEDFVAFTQHAEQARLHEAIALAAPRSGPTGVQYRVARSMLAER